MLHCDRIGQTAGHEREGEGVDDVEDISQLLGMSGGLSIILSRNKQEGISCVGRGEMEEEDSLFRSNC